MGYSPKCLSESGMTETLRTRGFVAGCELQSTQASVVVMHMPSCTDAWGIFLERG